MRKSIALIDGLHLSGVSRGLGFQVDFSKLLSFMRSREHVSLIRAHYFSPVWGDGEEDSIWKLLDWLEYNNYSVVRRLVKDGDSIRRNEPMSLEMSVTALEVAHTADEFIFVAGSEDLTLAVEALKRKGRVVTVISSIKITPAPISNALRRAADNFIELGDIIKKLELPPRKRD
jgi:uncharacterized LabA/DUF88 family protein